MKNETTQTTDATTARPLELVSVVTDFGSTKWIVRVNGRAVRNFWTRKGADRYLAKLNMGTPVVRAA